ncbi:uncharacterized protein [Littorina saxatilis]|uniref:C2H2-type domain-containing protein n=1 Tax=Littorina saxatilis TaxID=31220 RepID=A0AAN9B3Y9_9CAEN
MANKSPSKQKAAESMAEHKKDAQMIVVRVEGNTTTVQSEASLEENKLTGSQKTAEKPPSVMTCRSAQKAGTDTGPPPPKGNEGKDPGVPAPVSKELSSPPRRGTRKRPVSSPHQPADNPAEVPVEENVGEKTDGIIQSETKTPSHEKISRRPRGPASSPHQPADNPAEVSVQENVSEKPDGIIESESKMSSPEKMSRGPRGAFVPKYEPIQTRKRTKIPMEALSTPSLVSHSRKDSPTKPPRSRLSKVEVMTPDTSPRPRAVPRSMLILEPELLPRKFKKKRSQLASALQIHTSARVEKDSSISWPSASEGVKTVTSSSFEVSSLLLAAAESESAVQEIQVEQGEDGTSYILTSVPGVHGSAGAAASQIVRVDPVPVTEGGADSDTVVSEANSTSKGDTPTSLLLLAEAAYPTTAATPSSTLPTSATQSTAKNLNASTATSQRQKPNVIQAKAVSSPTVVNVTRKSSPISSTSAAKTQTQKPSATTTYPSSQWTCTVCGELMPEKDRAQHVAQHLYNEEEEEEFVCDACGEQCRDEEDLELHMAVEHDEEEGDEEDMNFDENEENNDTEQTEATQSIISTPVTTPTPALLSTASGTPVHTCGLCGETFPFAAYLRQHMKKSHSEAGAVFTCTVCSKNFSSKTALENHSRLHQAPGGSITFKCIRCMEHFYSAAALSSHALSCVKRAEPDTPKRGRGRPRGQGATRTHMTDAVCKVCNKSFSSDVYLQAHQLSHSCTTVQSDVPKTYQGIPGLQCLYCTDKFRHIGSLKEHILDKHPTAFPFRCRICHRGFSRDNSRIAHEQTHQTEKLFSCSQCGEGFTLQSYLNRHMKYRHLKLTRFPCSMCHKDFVRQADLIKHHRVHTGEKPYVCEECGHGFGQQSNYKYHMMRHRGEKPHVCPMCDKGFRVPSHLKMHMQQHLNERFTCYICDKVFSQSRYLQRHMRIHDARSRQYRESLLPSSSITNTSNNSGIGESVTVYTTTSNTQPPRTEQQVILDGEGTDVSEHVVVQDLNGEVEPVIEFIIDKGEDGEHGKRVEEVDSDGNIVVRTSSHPEGTPGLLKVEIEGRTASGEGTEEQAYVNPDEGTSVVVGDFSEGEGGSMEDGNVTIPFKDLTQLIGGKHYNCDVCCQSFSIQPNSTYNMIHTGQSHILVISLNDHSHHAQADS